MKENLCILFFIIGGVSVYIDPTLLHIQVLENIKLQPVISKLLPYMYKQQICHSNAIYMPHMPTHSCEDIRQLCQYICLIWTQYNQQCDDKYWYTYIHSIGMCPWTNMSATLRPHITLHTRKKNNKLQLIIYHAITIYVSNKYVPQICDICQFLHVHIWGKYVSR